MTVYFCLDDVFEILFQRDPADSSLDDLVPVQTKPTNCNGFREDALTLASRPQLLDVTDPKACYLLSQLLEDVPLYNINLEILIDDILSQRHLDKLVEQSITTAFMGQALPTAIPGGAESGLQHPGIGDIDRVTLSKIYLNFMQALPHGHDRFSFERLVLGNHAKPYHTMFDGFVTHDTGKVKAAILLGFGTRADYDPRISFENHIENGRHGAVAMRITEPHELVWAWMEADDYQLRRCHDIDRMLSLRGLPRMPNWVRTDILNCLEREAVKQVFAAKLIEIDPDLEIVAQQPSLRVALATSAGGQVDENLEQLLDYTMNPGTPHGGSAGKFYENALSRQRESRSI